ncbi:hypothetical protein EJ08DRAFT_690123, partial [Tothia fuscella]
MDLSRQDYPGMLTHIPPGQAVKILNDRIRYIGRVNVEVADWLQERRRIEEQYAQSMRKLAGKPFSDEASDLGIFSTPWQKIVSSTQALAESHYNLSQNIGRDVELPLRDFATQNAEMQAIATITGNIQSLGRDVENAQKKADKLKDKGGKAAAGKVASAASEVENAQGQWDSQAPYVFERLQAVDEARVNHLRDVLTQYQTHIIDSGSTVESTSAETMNALLNLQTEDEIKTFAMKTTRTLPTATSARRRMSRAAEQPPPPPPPTTDVGSSLSPVPSLPRPDDLSSQRSSSFQEKAGKSGFGGGLKSRLGTVIGRKRQSMHPYGQSLDSPERKKSSSNLGSALGRFGRKESHQNLERTLSPPSSARRPSSGPGESPRPSDSAPPPILERESSDHPNGVVPETNGQAGFALSLVNGTPSGDSQNGKPLSKSVQPKQDDEGFSVPSASSDPIQQALDEAAASNENTAPQFKVDIRSAPIAEESGDAAAALANVANALQATQPNIGRRSMGTIRGRRDRNTILLTNNQIPELPRDHSPAISNASSGPPLASPISPPVAAAVQPTPPIPHSSPHTGQSPFKLSHRSTLGLDDNHPASDTYSIRSGRSLSSTASTTIKHPEMHSAGLNTSIVEKLSAWFSNGTVTRAALTGEFALAYNPVDLNEPFGSETIRLETFSALEKVAPNPAFLEPVADQPGQYTVNLSLITKTTVAFKYQIHLAPDAIASYPPLLLRPAFKVEATQTSVLLNYSLNPAFAKKLPENTTSLTFSNVIIMVHLDPTGARATSCKAANGGAFARERNSVYWRLHEVTLARDGPAQILRARFLTDGEARPGNVEARWEIGNDQISEMGSGLSVSKLETKVEKEEGGEAADPFADETSSAKTGESSGTGKWKEINTIRSMRNGTYLAT